ncbi:MAG: DDE-type integrase/transposase/recombinase [Sedimenticola sp.]
MESQDNYTLQREVKRKFKRPRVIVSGQFEQYDADLADMSSISKDNDSIRFLLIVIDVFSRHLWIATLRDKTGKSVIAGFKEIFKNANKPLKIRTDGGSEFSNRWMKQFFKNLSIYHHVSLNETKAGYAERVIKTIKNILFRYFTKNRTYKYVDVLQDVVKTYNSTPHRSLNYTAPKDVNTSNEADLWAFMYLKPQSRTTTYKRTYDAKFKYQKDAMVRISHLKNVFTRSYQEHWSAEIFKIRSRFLIQGIPLYKLKDFKDEIVKGNFYEEELQKVAKEEDSLWFIERKVRKRKRDGKIEWLVKFEGWPDKYNMWISEEDIAESTVNEAQQ